MRDLISRQAAIDAVNNALISWSHMAEWRDNEIRKAIMEVPSAQPDWDEMLVICDCCGHAIHVKRLS